MFNIAKQCIFFFPFLNHTLKCYINIFSSSRSIVINIMNFSTNTHSNLSYMVLNWGLSNNTCPLYYSSLGIVADFHCTILIFSILFSSLISMRFSRFSRPVVNTSVMIDNLTFSDASNLYLDSRKVYMIFHRLAAFQFFKVVCSNR